MINRMASTSFLIDTFQTVYNGLAKVNIFERSRKRYQKLKNVALIQELYTTSNENLNSSPNCTAEVTFLDKQRTVNAVGSSVRF